MPVQVAPTFKVERKVASQSVSSVIQDFLRAYLEDGGADDVADLVYFLPQPDHQHYLPVLQELIKVDHQRAWQRRHPHRLEKYQRLFPEAFTDLQWLQNLARADYQWRWQAGQRPSPEEYQLGFGVETTAWPRAEPIRQQERASRFRALAKSFHQRSQAGDNPLDPHPPLSPHMKGENGDPESVQLLRELQEEDAPATFCLAAAVAATPEVNTEFLGFRLLAELGQGAFGKVYLAQQETLANRQVVLKVSADITAEAHMLAQLLHTNIVPVYSIHHATPLQAVCMPYLGATTLADVLRKVAHGHALPKSGKALISTLHERKHTVQSSLGRPTVHSGGSQGPVSRPTPAPAAVASSLPRQVNSTILLDKLAGLSYGDAILWIGSRLADGLAHAHERGIWHRDLKPANILLTDEGQPMLLDFNLAEDVKLRGSAAAARLGGTLPYMAPEQLKALSGDNQAAAALDGRSDIYALGVILFELLTGRLPFPSHDGPTRKIVDNMIADRQGPPPRLRDKSSGITPAGEAVVRRCLEPDPAQRYGSARELQEDLERHLGGLPLRHTREPSLRERAGKWLRRHPRLTSLTSVCAVAGLLLALVLGFSWVHVQRSRQLEALDLRQRFQDDATAMQFMLTAQGAGRADLAEPLALGHQALARYQVLQDPGWEKQTHVRYLPSAQQDQLREEVGYLLLLLARAQALQSAALGTADERTLGLKAALELNEQAQKCYPTPKTPRALWNQRAELAGELNQSDEAANLRQRAAEAPLQGSPDRCLLAREHLASGRFRDALPLLRQATRANPQNVQGWFLLGRCLYDLKREREAAASYTTAIALWPRAHQLYFNRGLAYLRSGDFPQAWADFDEVIRLQPSLAEAYFNRAVANYGLQKYADALADLDRALEHNAPYTRIYFFRARLHDKLGDKAAARQDRDEGLRREPAEEHSWNARGFAKMSSDPKGALADFAKALELNRRYRPALENQAHVLAEVLNQTQEAIAVLDRIIALYPDYVPARASRGVLWTRLEKREAALKDAVAALQLSQEPAIAY